jgi:hypothetical protein
VAVGVALSIFGYVTSTNDTVVDESIVMGTPMGGESSEQRNVELSSGNFESLEHSTSGKAAVVELANGDRRLTLSNFSTDAGPDLRVYLAEEPSTSNDQVGDFVDLGGLKGNRGNQQYVVPKTLPIDQYKAVVVWCRLFSVGFGQAKLS